MRIAFKLRFPPWAYDVLGIVHLLDDIQADLTIVVHVQHLEGNTGKASRRAGIPQPA